MLFLVLVADFFVLVFVNGIVIFSFLVIFVFVFVNENHTALRHANVSLTNVSRHLTAYETSVHHCQKRCSWTGLNQVNQTNKKSNILRSYYVGHCCQAKMHFWPLVLYSWKPDYMNTLCRLKCVIKWSQSKCLRVLLKFICMFNKLIISASPSQNWVVLIMSGKIEYGCVYVSVSLWIKVWQANVFYQRIIHKHFWYR